MCIIELSKLIILYIIAEIVYIKQLLICTDTGSASDHYKFKDGFEEVRARNAFYFIIIEVLRFK